MAPFAHNLKGSAMALRIPLTEYILIGKPSLISRHLVETLHYPFLSNGNEHMLKQAALIIFLIFVVAA